MIHHYFSFFLINSSPPSLYGHQKGEYLSICYSKRANVFGERSELTVSIDEVKRENPNEKRDYVNLEEAQRR